MNENINSFTTNKNYINFNIKYLKLFSAKIFLKKHFYLNYYKC